MLLSHILATVLVSTIPATLAASNTPCNNSPSLCNRAYNNVTHLGAHDSPFLRPSLAGNQYYNSTTQLSAGVRLLTGQTYTTNATSGLHLCHTTCDLLDAGRLSTWLSSIKTWLDNNPTDVVTILLVNGNGASSSSIAAEYTAANITSYAFTPSSTATSPTGAHNSGIWPTLQTLISSNSRLITFIASLVDTDSSAPYLLNQFDYVFENPYNYTWLTDFSCQPERPSDVLNNYPAAQSAGLMPLMNHFVYTALVPGVQIPDEGSIYQTNAPIGSPNCTTGCLGTTAEQCTAVYGRAPSYVLVDFVNVGPSIETMDRLNGVDDAVGRLSLSGVAAVSAGGSSSGSVGGATTTSVAGTGPTATSTSGKTATTGTTATNDGVLVQAPWFDALLAVTGAALFSIFW